MFRDLFSCDYKKIFEFFFTVGQWPRLVHKILKILEIFVFFLDNCDKCFEFFY